MILVPDVTHLTGGSIITQRATLMEDTFTPWGSDFLQIWLHVSNEPAQRNNLL